MNEITNQKVKIVSFNKTGECRLSITLHNCLDFFASYRLPHGVCYPSLDSGILTVYTDKEKIKNFPYFVITGSEDSLEYILNLLNQMYPVVEPSVVEKEYEVIYLQYSEESGWVTNRGRWVTIDKISGYPTAVDSIEYAHNFRTVEEALKYCAYEKEFKIRKFKVTYTAI